MERDGKLWEYDMEGMLEPGADRCMVYVLGALLVGIWDCGMI
jgi:hypothetical protein